LICAVEAQELWQDDVLIELEARSDDEPRFVVIGVIGGKHYSAIMIQATPIPGRPVLRTRSTHPVELL